MLTSPETCKKKRRYYSANNANRAAKRKNLIERYKWLTYYKCNVCEQYHLTTRKDNNYGVDNN